MRALCRSLVLAGALLAGVAAPVLRAQETPPPPPADRDLLEQRVRQRMAQVIQRQVGLTDEQMRRLGVANRKFEQQQRDLFVRERQVRLGLRDELALADTSRQAQVSRLIDQMLQIQRQRVDLLEAEQRELATFMTPQQRARYFGMQEQIRRRVEEMRDQGGRPGPGGEAGAPGGARRPGGVLGPPGGGVRGGVRRPPGGAS